MANATPPRPEVRGTPGRAVVGSSFLLGLLVFACGIACYLSAVWASLASIIFLGVVLLLAGIIEIAHGFRERATDRFLPYLLGGTLTLVVGGLFLARPVGGLQAVTLLLAGYFFASGIFRLITSIANRYRAWGWDVFSGVISVLLGIWVIASWPASSLILLGVLLAIELVLRGIGMMSLALAARRVALPSR